MPASFDEAVRVVLEHEGGLVDHPEDPGGVTNYGISLRWAVHAMIDAGDTALELLDIDGDGDTDADDVRTMQRADAVVLYRAFWWDRYRYGEIQDQTLATKVFDLAVNMGPKQAHRCAQRAVRGIGDDLVDDGILGPLTRAALNLFGSVGLIPPLRSEAAGFYRALIVRNDALRRHGIEVPDFGVFKRGWLRRAYA